MQRLNTSYSTYFNRKHRRSGDLLGRRFKAKVFEEDEYLLKLTRYIHLNPVKIKKYRNLELEEKVKILRGYRWSSYRGYAGLAKTEKVVDYGPLHELVGRGRKKKEQGYRRYVESGLAEDDEELQEAMTASQIFWSSTCESETMNFNTYGLLKCTKSEMRPRGPIALDIRF